MQRQDTAQAASLAPSRNGVLFLSGFATSLSVRRGLLFVRTGQGRSIIEGQFSRVFRPRIRRVVIFGKGGFTTWEALHWLDGIGASFVNLSLSGRLVASSSGDLGPNQPALRRAQVQAADTKVGVEIVRHLLGAKLKGQRDVLVASVPGAENEIADVTHASVQVATAETIKEALAIEARAAAAYWKAWSALRLMSSRGAQASLPDHWRSAGDRRSPLSGSPRLAATPVGAMLNYLYALAEFECRLGLLAVGLDPGLGWAHKDANYRDSAALDLLEALRPQVDAHIANLLAERTFSRREFIELPSGQVRLTRSLAKDLATSTLSRWEQVAGQLAERVGGLIAASATTPVRTPGRKTRGSRGKGRSTLGRRVAPSLARTKRIAAACRECGVVLNRTGRVYCDDCLPAFKDERTGKLVNAARDVLTKMRASEGDPARSSGAKDRRVATNGERRRQALAWEQDNPGPHDPSVFTVEILPGLRNATLPQMMKVSGLTSGYCWRIRRGERVPHPMYWEPLRSLSSAT
jgi:CRISP-associated protein Cas1